jgi:endogenous inhibitor of DNA gyrase (YacG/DUF329 family)
MDLSTMTTPSCPTCGAALPATASPKKDEAARFLPFCSARCQLVDLGNWLGERYTVPGEPALLDSSEPEQPSS